MTRHAPFLAAALLAPALAGCAMMYDAVGTKYSTSLSGGREVPGPGDREGSGIADLIVDANAPQICFTVEVHDIAPATMAHIHRGRAGEAGPPVLTLEPPIDGKSDGCIRVARALAQEINVDPSGFYVNVHNAEFPNGALRGQLGFR